MKIKAVIEKDDGTFEFSANLTAEQHQFLIEYAIQDLLRKGLFVPEIGGETTEPNIVAN